MKWSHHKINTNSGRLHVIAHRAMLDVSRELAQFVGRLLAAERRRRGTRNGSRALTCYWQAVMALRWFRHGGDKTALGRDHGVSRSTAYRYIDEVIEVLAAWAPDLRQALERADADGLAYLILDGKIFSADRCGEQTTSIKGESIDVWYSGKAHEHGGLIQAISAPDGFPLWVSDVEPGSTHDLTAAQQHVLGALYAAAAHGLPTLADLGYDGVGHGVHIPIKHPTDGNQLHVDNRTYNTLLRSLRCLGERGFALLVGRWRTLRHTTASPSKIGTIVKAALVLTHFEHDRLT
jgi:DDE superfamily endonuclease